VRREIAPSAFASRAYLLPAAGGLAAAAALAAASLAGFAADARGSLADVAVLACTAAATTLGGMLREVAYYRSSGAALARIDGIAMAAAAAGVLGAWWFGAPLGVAFAMLLLVQAARSLALARTANDPHR
jgi:hypothetical protein